MAHSQPTLYLGKRSVARRYDRSTMWIERELRRSASTFPKPAMRINGHRLWSVADLEAWERAHRGQL